MAKDSLRAITTALTVTVVFTFAQQACAQTMASAPRLGVRPHQMATGTRTEKAGLTQLAGLPEYYLYVPQQCVGTKRVPLIVLPHGGGRSANMEIQKFSTLADKHGMMVLAVNASQPGQWDIIYGGMSNTVPTETGLKVSKLPMRDVQNIDSAMQYVLRTYAIDPDRIALLGFSDGGSASLLLGRSNLDVFSRIAALSALIPFDGTGPKNPNTQFMVSGGIAEDMAAQTVKMAQVLRKEGHPVVTLLGLRGHVDRVVDEDFVWAWLLQSWADPKSTTRVIAPADSDPVLTVDAMTKLTTFWTRFQQAPDSIRTAGRFAHQMKLSLALGAEPVWVITMDLPAMAAQYPSVAADLQAAGLTAAQAAAYRAAVLRVGLARMGGIAPGGAVKSSELGQSIPFAPIAPTSVLGQNLAFRNAHPEAFTALSKTGMWTTQ